ncbi:hypothetical protein [Arthrobacter sp. B2a2-09]|uniref:hypothetical protein n=1 Tax=Arthrobacter sp. B2a2-09 TaxID=2952822 RepID=UPI0022CD7423|nr:hypothetical protein [Arthrobacter sp. B2a2-09]MCZ9880196.1 hypothetical protein [Arthrobacter sp. B2a2-09]
MTGSSNPTDSVAGMLAALAHIDGADFHGIDTALRKESPIIDEFWSSRVRAAQIAAASIPWPEELEEHAKSLGAAADRLGAALSGGEVKTAAAAAKEAHKAWHTLNTPAWNYLAETAGIQISGGAHEHRHQH